MQYTTIDENSFAYGIDARSAENQVKMGFVRDLVNADIIEGRIKKRRGYTTYAGELPLRVVQYKVVDGSPDKASFLFDSSIDISRLQSTPILVYGRSGLSGITGPFNTTSDTAQYFTSWTSNVRKTYAANTASSISAPATEHGITTTQMFVGIAESTQTGTDLSSRELFEGNDLTYNLEINKSTRDITSGYTNNTASPVDTFLYYSDQTSISTINYVTTFSVAANTTTNPPIEITAATHQLQNYNITYQLWEDNGTSYIKVRPDIFSVDSASGLVSVTVTNSTSGTINYRLLLSVVPAGNAVERPITVGTNSITITDITSPFLFYTLYAVDNTTRTEIWPDSFEYDDVADTLTLTFTNNTAGAITAKLNYLYGTLRTNEIMVETTGVAASLTDSVPQLTVYGLSQSLIYGSDKEVNRRGWVTHLDSYRSPTKTHLVSGLGGNLFAALTTSEMPASFATAMPTYYPNLNARLLSASKLGPLFWDTGEAPALDRGTISFDGGGTNWAIVTSVIYQGSGITRYLVSVPNAVKVGNPVTINQDYLTVKGMSHSRHNGTFKITNVTYNIPVSPSPTSTIQFDVENTNLTTSDYDDAGTAGLGGVFTDSFITTSASPFLAKDKLLSSYWGEETELSVLSVNSTKTIIAGIYEYLDLGSGLVITGQRTSKEIPLRDLLNLPKSDNLVAGDTIFYSDLTRPLQIAAVNPTTSTITLSETITWYDSLIAPPSFTVPQRWVPAESPKPDSGDLLLPSTTVRNLSSNSYDNQPFLRSVMVQNNLYLTNGSDEVYKYDGSSFYRAGIIPWQPGLFTTIREGTGITFTGINAVAALTGGTIVVSKADATSFPVGTVVQFTDSLNTTPTILTVASNTEKSASDHSLTFQETLNLVAGGTTGKLRIVYEARYDFRLNIKDVNGVTIASAVTGAADFVVRVAPNPDSGGVTQFKVQLRLVGLPAWDQYDFTNKNIELKIYRTHWAPAAQTAVPIFYEIATKPITYVGADGYIDFEDVYSNTTLIDLDPVVSVLSPSIVPAGWDEPVRAKYVTSAGNRLVLANVVDWPTLAIAYQTASSISYTSYNGQKFLFHRSNTDTATDTNMVDRVTYELRSSGGVTTSAWSAVTDTSFTFTANVGRAVSVGEWVYIYFNVAATASAATHGLRYCGWWQVANRTLVSGTTYTITVNSTSALSTSVPTTNIPYALFSTSAYDVPVNIDGDYNMGMVNGDTVNFLAPAPRILRRIGMAINATMRMTNLDVHNQSAFKPWLVARSESDTQGQLIVKQPRAEVLTPSVTIIGGPTDVTYVNGSKVVTLDSPPTSVPTKTKALTTRYPSRLLVSYNNYPEIFDNPFTVNDDLSASAIDINSSDGQEITGVIPFFGESAFGAALQSGVLVVFKQNSIYLVDLSEKRSGRNPVQRLETQGLGCTAPYSIAPTKDGIAFANDSGIYVLRRNQRIEYLGRYMERNWQQSVDKDWLNLVQGHHYNVGRQYKLSVPLLAGGSPGYSENSEVYVYNHTNEGTDEPGGWGRYTNHPATGWANLYQDAFYATVNGSVKRLRAEGVPEDYRDDAAAIEAVLTTRATDFGQAGIRKVVSHVVVNYRTGGTSENTSVEISPDLRTDFDTTTSFTVVNYPADDGISSVSGQDIRTIRHSLTRRRCVYMTVRISNTGIDEALEIAGMSYVVAGLNSKGIVQAASTKK